MDGIDGCQGANLPAVGDFVRHFASEPQISYPFGGTARCLPLGRAAGLELAYIRMECDYSARVVARLSASRSVAADIFTSGELSD